MVGPIYSSHVCAHLHMCINIWRGKTGLFPEAFIDPSVNGNVFSVRVSIKSRSIAGITSV